MARTSGRALAGRPFPTPSARKECKEPEREHALLVRGIPEMQNSVEQVKVGANWSGGSLSEEYPWRLAVRFHPIERPEQTVQVDAWFTRGPWATMFVAYFWSMDAMVRECIESLRDSTDPAHQQAIAMLQPLLAF